MKKALVALKGLMSRRKAPAGDGASMPVPASADAVAPDAAGEAPPVPGGPHESNARSEAHPLPDALPGDPTGDGPASFTDEGTDSENPTALPVPVPQRTRTDLAFALAGVPGLPGIVLTVHHLDTDLRMRDRFPDALFPEEVSKGDYFLDVTGHALTFGPGGRTEAHVLVPVRTGKGSGASMPRNALGNVLVPIEGRIVERIDRETGAAKTRLRRLPVVAIAFAGSGALDEPSEAVDDVAAVPDIAAGMPDAMDLDAPVGIPDAAHLATPAEDRARRELDMMGFLLAQQSLADPSGGAAVSGGIDLRKDRDHEPGTTAPVPADPSMAPGMVASEREWTPSGAYGR